jgi:hypothetical protein
MKRDKEAKMPIASLLDNPQGSQEIYEKIREHIRLDAPAGGVLHLAGPSPTGGWRVIEIWESEEDARRFHKERLMPAVQALGLPVPPSEPQFWPLHNVMN